MTDDQRRRTLIEEITAEVRETARWTGREALDPRVLTALERTPREAFVNPSSKERAYENRPLSIGHRQTISQPFIVAIMTDLLQVEPDSIVLEVGTGSAYQAAVLAKLAKHVYSVEVIPELAASAADCLARMGYRNVTVECRDGSKGWPEHAPFDRIIVTAGPAEMPQTLVDQLGNGGRMIVPVGSMTTGQTLTLVTKDESGRVEIAKGLPVAFVPLVSR